MYPNTYNYLLLTQSGLYKLYKPSSSFDTVDLSNMDTAVPVTLNRTTPFSIQPGFSPYPTLLTGVPDTTDLSSAILLSTETPPLPHSDFAIPKTPMQKYELRLSAANSVGDNVFFYNYGSTVATTPVFPDPNSFNILSNQTDSFNVSWSGTRPSYVWTQWGNNTVFLELYNSPDSTVQHPTSFLTGLNSKLLKGQPLGGMTISSIQIEAAPGFNYNAFMTYSCDSSLYLAHGLSTSSYLFRYFY